MAKKNTPKNLPTDDSAKSKMICLKWLGFKIIDDQGLIYLFMYIVKNAKSLQENCLLECLEFVGNT